jgi:glycosyltransferase involved in cell wall biosynthesis
MNILFFGPFNYRARDNESLMIRFCQMGHKVHFLTMSEGTFIIPVLEANGIACYRMNIVVKSKIDIFRQAIFLLQFIRKNKINRVFSHLEPANLLAVLIQSFTKAKVFIVRHHSDDIILQNQHRRLTYRFTYRFAKKIIVVSNFAKKVMTLKEGVDSGKIDVIPLSYDFSLFSIPDPNIVKKIRYQFDTPLLILCVGRLVANKGFQNAIDIAACLKQKGKHFKMIIVGEGPLFDTLKQMVVEKDLSDHCYVLGYKPNIMDYIEACDLVLHPSISESSSVIVKEAGLRKKMVIACQGVGDFDEIINNEFNGLLFSPGTFNEQVISYINNIAEVDKLKSMGNNLYSAILENFDINNNITLYHKYLS